MHKQLQYTARVCLILRLDQGSGARGLGLGNGVQPLSPHAPCRTSRPHLAGGNSDGARAGALVLGVLTGCPCGRWAMVVGGSSEQPTKMPCERDVRAQLTAGHQFRGSWLPQLEKFSQQNYRLFLKKGTKYQESHNRNVTLPVPKHLLPVLTSPGMFSLELPVIWFLVLLCPVSVYTCYCWTVPHAPYTYCLDGVVHMARFLHLVCSCWTRQHRVRDTASAWRSGCGLL